MLFPAAVYAHTGLKTASPEESELVTKPLEKIYLTFATKIESISKIKVLDESGNEVPVKVVTGKDDMTGTFETPLPNGKYTVEWKIIGADGHAIKDQYSFTLDAPDTVAEEPLTEEQSTANQDKPVNDDTGAANTTETIDTSRNIEPEEQKNDTDQSVTSNVITKGSMSSSSLDYKTIIGIVILVCCGVLAIIGIRAIRNSNKNENS